IAAAHARSGFDLVDRLGLEGFAVAWQERAVRRPRSPAANREKDVVGVAQVGAGIFDCATEILERRALAIEDLAHAGVDRQVAEGQAPGDAHAAEVTIERLRERGRIRWIAARVA